MIRKYAEIFCWKNVSSFCSAKATHIFAAKNIRILYIESAKTVNEMTLNKLVKLTTLWTTGPWTLIFGAGTPLFSKRVLFSYYWPLLRSLVDINFLLFISPKHTSVLTYMYSLMSALVAQLDAHQTGDQEVAVAGSTLAGQQHSFVEIW